MDNPLYVHTGDVVFCHGGNLLSKLIRWAERAPGEDASWSNHVGIVTRSGWMFPVIPGIMEAHVAEALWHVENGPWYSRHRNDAGYAVEIFRLKDPGGCPPLAVEYAASMTGAKYGWWKLGAHLIDRLVFKGKKVVSNYLFKEHRPICSFLVAHALELCGITFGTEADAADPDSMHDHCKNSPEWIFVGKGEVKNELV